MTSADSPCPPPAVDLYGIRHHGPGSARAVQRGLRTAPPDIVLIEGPREAEAIVSLVGYADMRAPVTMLGYALDRPQRAVFHPFASFSPEWVAMRWACDAAVPIRFVDLALTNTLADWPGEARVALSTGEERPADPLTDLAAAAGYDDTERWWEDVVEHRGGVSPFDAVAEAMTALRSFYEPELVPADPMERRREAQMRSGIRAAIKDGFRRIAVICGAWHVPALTNATDARQARADTALLRGMPKVKVAVTWVPWTHRRLASATGYGAGVTSPGWYHHLFTNPGADTVAHWFTLAARVLRASDHSASAADVVEATRLATALAALRGRPLPGLVEMNDATRAVLGDGTDTPMLLIDNELVVGTIIGHVPAHTPMVPLARDLAGEQRRCRLRPSAGPRPLELDLRRRLDLSRSRLLHRLALLGAPWGREVDGRRSAGTFRETWELLWEPELEVALIAASAFGTTIEAAAVAAVTHRSAATRSLVEQCLLADLTKPLATLVGMVADRAALDSDVTHLMDALPALSRTARYGDVRGTDAGALATVLGAMVGRISAGLMPSCVGLDAESATAMSRSIDDTRSALSLLADADLFATFHTALADLVEREHVHPILQGRATRVLADAGSIDPLRVEARVSRALTVGTAPSDGAAFVEGFLGGSGTVLVHDADLLGLVDRWLATLDAPAFADTLPLLRRTFATFEAAERRQIADRIRSGGGAGAPIDPVALDPERVAAALHTIRLLLGAPA